MGKVTIIILTLLSCTNSFAFNLIVESDSRLKKIFVLEYSGTGSTELTIGSNEITLENYPNAIYLYHKKGLSKYDFTSLIWVASDTSTVKITIDANYQVVFPKDNPYQFELNRIFDSTRNIHLGPFTYEPMTNKPLAPILAMEAKAIIQNLDVYTDQKVLMNLFKLSQEREIDNWSTEVLSAYLEEPLNDIYNQSTHKLIKVKGLDSLEQQVEVKPNGNKYMLVAISGSWCGPCIKGLPKMRKLYDEVSDQVLFVSTWNDPNLETFVNNHRDLKASISWPSLWDPYGLMAKSIQTHAYPSYVLFDPTGIEVNRWDGKFPDNLSDFTSN